jgi:hypothetical protein
MLPRVLVNISDYPPKLAVARDRYAPERVLEQASRALVGVVDPFGIGVEEIRELGAYIFKKYS